MNKYYNNQVLNVFLVFKFQKRGFKIYGELNLNRVDLILKSRFRGYMFGGGVYYDGIIVCYWYDRNSGGLFIVQLFF